jgi:hypothetical protein
MREGNRDQFSGRVLQLGSQDLLATEDSLEKITQEDNFKLLEAHCDMWGVGNIAYSITE